MKKIIAAFLCAAVCLMAGCSKNEGTTSSAGGSTISFSNTPRDPNSSAAASSVASIPTVSVPAVTPAANGFRRGEWSGNTYTSDFYGFSVNVDGGWDRETDAQLAARNGIGDMDAATINDTLDADKQVYELYSNKVGVGSLGIASNKIKGTTMSEYIRANVNQMKKLTTTFSDISEAKITVSGKEQDCIYVTYIAGGTNVSEALVLYQNEDYYCLITLAAMSPEALRELIGFTFGVSSEPSGNTSQPAVTPTTPAATTFGRGSWNGDRYTAGYFGYSLNLGGYVNESDAQLAVRNSMSDMSEASFVNEVNKGDGSRNIYDVFAQYTGGRTLAVAYNKLVGVTAKDLIQQTADVMETMSTMFGDVSVDTISSGGKSLPCVYTTLSSGSAKVYEVIIAYQNGDYFSVITMGAASQGELRLMLATVIED